MSERTEPIAAKTNEIKKYSFEEGVSNALTKINQLLNEKKSVIVAVIGSSINTGKTTVSSEIGKKLIEKGIEVKWCPSVDLITQKIDFPAPGEVLILQAESPFIGDDELKNQAEKFGLSHKKIDLRVFIYRPDKPFPPNETKSADILICNKGARDKNK